MSLGFSEFKTEWKKKDLPRGVVRHAVSLLEDFFDTARTDLCFTILTRFLADKRMKISVLYDLVRDNDNAITYDQWHALFTKATAQYSKKALKNKSKKKASAKTPRKKKVNREGGIPLSKASGKKEKKTPEGEEEDEVFDTPLPSFVRSDYMDEEKSQEERSDDTQGVEEPKKTAWRLQLP